MPQGDKAKGRRLKVKRGYAYAAITGVLFSLLEPISKIIADDVDAFSITVIRFFIGAICLLPVSYTHLDVYKRQVVEGI